METPAVLVRRAREAAGLKPEQLAAWARLEPERLDELEAGRAEFTWRELDRCARVFGLRVDDLLDGEAGWAPMAVLLRSDRTESSLGVQDHLTVDSCELLGEFQRALRDIADLEQELELSPSALPAISSKDARKGELHPGERLARAARKELGLADDAIPRMVDLLHRLGVCVLFDLVHRALKEGRIPPSRARRMLGVPCTEPLPFEDLSLELRAPTLTGDIRAIRVATGYLFEKHPTYFARDVEPLDGKWRVAVYDGHGPRGSLLIGPSYAVEHDDTYELTAFIASP